MRTQIHPSLEGSAPAREMDRILRSCVHCGFCTSACPTYRLRGDELDGPRGRIYLIKEMLANDAAGRRTQRHLDRCLTCRACETACPSEVQYGRLVELGREMLEARVPRGARQRLLRALIARLLPMPRLMRALVGSAQLVAPVLPERLRRRVPERVPLRRRPAAAHARRVVLLEGCVQRAATPQVNAAAARLLDQAGVAALRVPDETCCGALPHHLGRTVEAHDRMRRNVAAFAPLLADGAEAIVSTASGCGVTLKDYGRQLSDDGAHAEAAQHVGAGTRDLGEYLLAIGYRPDAALGRGRRVAWHAPCTLQHGQHAADAPAALLRQAGYELVPVAEPTICCGSAGTYSILEPELSRELLARKVQALTGAGPELIATANIGCHLHLATAAPVPVRHWAELLCTD